MRDDFLAPLIGRIDRSQRAGMRLGTVTAIDTEDASVTVDAAGDEIPGVRWVDSYTPTVADIVVVSRVDAMWVVLGRLSKQWGAPDTIIDTVVVDPVLAWDGYLAEDVWTWAVAPRAGILGGPPGQGRRWPFGVQEDLAGVWLFEGVADAIGPGVVLSAQVRVVRWVPNAEQSQLAPEAALVAPRLWRHVHTSMPSGSPLLVAPDWQPGTVAAGGTAVWPLPETWLTDLVSASAAGLAVSSDAAADWTRWASLRLEVQVERSLVP